jgi:hypothetical protein
MTLREQNLRPWHSSLMTRLFHKGQGLGAYTYVTLINKVEVSYWNVVERSLGRCFMTLGRPIDAWIAMKSHGIKAQMVLDIIKYMSILHSGIYVDKL